MRKFLLTYTSFVIACLVVIIAFITATTYTQLAVGILLYPLLVYFSFKVFPRRMRGKHTKHSVLAQQPVSSTEKIEEEKHENVGITDIDKRVFLKLIGATGLSVFLFSLFNKKAEGILFKNLPSGGKVALEDIEGKKIDPAQNQPMDGYRISEIDDDVISFYGFTNKNGTWYIMRIDTDNGSFRYSTGNRDFPTNWGNREGLDYDYFDNVFGR